MSPHRGLPLVPYVKHFLFPLLSDFSPWNLSLKTDYFTVALNCVAPTVGSVKVGNLSPFLPYLQCLGAMPGTL